MPLFKRKKVEAKPDIHQTVERMNSTLSTMNKKIEYLEGQITAENNKIRQHLQAGNRTQAAASLRRRKLLDQQLKTLQGTQFKMEQQVSTVENVEFNKEILDTMRQSTNAIKDVYAGMNVDDVADVMDDMQEQMDLMDEINDAISQPFGAFADLEDGLDEELDQLAEMELDKQFMGAQGVGTTAAADATATSTASAAPVAAAGKTDEEAANDLAGMF